MMAEKNKDLLIKISSGSIIKIILILLIAYLLFLIRDVLLIFYVALIFAAAIDPWADLAEKYKLPRGLAVIVAYALLFGVLSLSVALLIGPLTAQFKELVDSFPAIWQKISQTFFYFKSYSIEHGFYKQLEEAIRGANLNLGAKAGGVIIFTQNIFQGFFSFFIVLVLTFFLVSSRNFFKEFLKSVTSDVYHPSLNQIFEKIQFKIGGWIRGQILLCFIIFALAYLGLVLIGVKYSLVLALFAGVTEFIPYLGPFIGAVPVVIIAFFQSPMLALWVIVWYAFIQQFENNVLVPKVMQKAVGLNPVYSILALLIGAQFAGVIGLILAIPSATIISVIVQEIMAKRQKDDAKI